MQVAEDTLEAAEPGDGLAAVVALRRLAERLEALHVERALRLGWTWGEVAEALGVSKQAVHKKHAKRLREVGIDTGRKRVQPFRR